MTEFSLLPFSVQLFFLRQWGLQSGHHDPQGSCDVPTGGSGMGRDHHFGPPIMTPVIPKTAMSQPRGSSAVLRLHRCHPRQPKRLPHLPLEHWKRSWEASCKLQGCTPQQSPSRAVGRLPGGYWNHHFGSTPSPPPCSRVQGVPGAPPASLPDVPWGVCSWSFAKRFTRAPCRSTIQLQER